MSSDRTSRCLRHDIRGLLTSLGGTADEIAATLERSGVRGMRSDSRHCAIAVYVHAVMGADDRVGSVGVGSRWLSVRRSTRWPLRTVTLMPRPARRFVRHFDAGRFPQLVRGDGAWATQPLGRTAGRGPGSALGTPSPG